MEKKDRTAKTRDSSQTAIPIKMLVFQVGGL